MPGADVGPVRAMTCLWTQDNAPTTQWDRGVGKELRRGAKSQSDSTLTEMADLRLAA